MKCPYCGMHYVTAFCPNCRPNPDYMIPPPAVKQAQYGMPQPSPQRSLPAPQPGQNPPAGQFPPPAQPPRRVSKVNPLVLTAAIIAGIAFITVCSRFTIKNLLGTRLFKDPYGDKPYNRENPYEPKLVINDGYYPAGSYTAGPDIPIGSFVIQCDNRAPAHLQIDSGNQTVFDDEVFDGQYVTLKLGESVTISGGTLIDAEDCSDVLFGNPFFEVPNDERMFMAGRDFPAGTYQVVLNADGVIGAYSIADHGIGSSDTVRDYDVLDDEMHNSAIIYIKEGEIIQLMDTLLVNYDDSEYSDLIDKFPQEGEYYPDGDYTIGEEIPAGRYIIYPDMPFELLTMHKNGRDGDHDLGRSFYMELSDHSNPIISGWKDTNCYVDLEDGQQLHLENGRIVSTALYGNLLDPYTDSGMYVVGNDLPAGTYMLVQNGSFDGDCVLFPNVPNDLTADILYNTVEDGIPIKLEDGQCVQLYCCSLRPMD